MPQYNEKMHCKCIRLGDEARCGKMQKICQQRREGHSSNLAVWTEHTHGDWQFAGMGRAPTYSDQCAYGKKMHVFYVSLSTLRVIVEERDWGGR